MNATPVDGRLWEKIKNKWFKGEVAGVKNSWNARKAQLAVKEYKSLGGKYVHQSPEEKSNNSLSIWTKEEWNYIDEKNPKRYLPVKVKKLLTKKEIEKENKLKAARVGDKVPYSPEVLSKIKKVRVGKMANLPKRRSDGSLIFTDYDNFRPNLTPGEIFEAGAFGGTYWRPISSGVTHKKYTGVHKKYTNFSGISEEKLSSPVCNPAINKYKVVSGTSLEYWESKGWIVEQDPYGWVQWYTNFYNGRRSPDDERQIARWLAFTGPKGRFRLRLINMLKAKNKKYNDYSVSPVIRQGLLQWAYELTSLN